MAPGPLTLPTLRGERVVLRPAGDEDAPALAAILADPEVSRWWGRWDVARVRAELLEPGEALAVLVDGEVSGCITVYEEPDPDYRHVAIDVFLASGARGRGIGREALRLVIAHWSRAGGHHRFTIDPAAANERAIRAFAGVGFRPVGVLRAHERAGDGTWRDGLLMDLLGGELT